MSHTSLRSPPVSLPGIRELFSGELPPPSTPRSPPCHLSPPPSGLYASHGNASFAPSPPRATPPLSVPRSLAQMPNYAPRSATPALYHSGPPPSGDYSVMRRPAGLPLGGSAARPQTPAARSQTPAVRTQTPAVRSQTPIVRPPTRTDGAQWAFAVLESNGETLDVAASASTYKDMLNAAKSHMVRKGSMVGRDADGNAMLEDPHVCPYCGKVCDRPSTLKTHINSHTGERPHVCYVPGCGRQFTVLSNMYRHAKICNGQRSPSDN